MKLSVDDLEWLFGVTYFASMQALFQEHLWGFDREAHEYRLVPNSIIEMHPNKVVIACIATRKLFEYRGDRDADGRMKWFVGEGNNVLTFRHALYRQREEMPSPGYYSAEEVVGNRYKRVSVYEPDSKASEFVPLFSLDPQLAETLNTSLLQSALFFCGLSLNEGYRVNFIPVEDRIYSLVYTYPTKNLPVPYLRIDIYVSGCADEWFDQVLLDSECSRHFELCEGTYLLSIQVGTHKITFPERERPLIDTKALVAFWCRLTRDAYDSLNMDQTPNQIYNELDLASIYARVDNILKVPKTASLTIRLVKWPCTLEPYQDSEYTINICMV